MNLNQCWTIKNIIQVEVKVEKVFPRRFNKLTLPTWKQESPVITGNSELNTECEWGWKRQDDNDEREREEEESIEWEKWEEKRKKVFPWK